MVAVKVNASEFEGWFYEGAGIYRHVWLVKTAPLAIAPDGIFVYSQFKNNIPKGPAKIHIQTRLLNSQTTSADATVKGQILESGRQPDGQSSGFGQCGAPVEKRSGAGRGFEFAGALVAGIAQTLPAGHDG